MKLQKYHLILLLIFSIIGCNKTEDQELKIGVIAPLTGEASFYGNSLKKGIELAKLLSDKKNDYKIKIIYEDSKANPSDAVSSISKLINIDKVDCIIGDMFSSTTMAIAPIAKRNNLLLVSPTASSSFISQIGPTIYRLYPSETEEGLILSNYIRKNFPNSKIALLTLNEDAMLKVKNVISKNIKTNIVKEVVFNKNQMRFQDIISRLDKDISVVVVLGYINDVSYIARQSKELGREYTLFSLSTIYDPNFINLTQNASNGVYLTAPFFDASSEKYNIHEFANKYKDKFGDSPNVWAGYGFDALNIVLQAFNEARGKNIKLNESFAEIKAFDGVTGNTVINSDRTIFKEMRIIKIVNKNFVSL